MAKQDKKDKNSCKKSCRLGKVGGQAVLDGVMMKSGERVALSVRSEGKIKTEISSSKPLRKKYKILGIPLLRGVVNMVESLSLSYKTLTRSAEMLGIEEEEPGKFERWLNKVFGDKLMTVVMAVAGVLGVLLAMGLFMFIPSTIGELCREHIIGDAYLWLKELVLTPEFRENTVGRFLIDVLTDKWILNFIVSALEGVTRIVVFIVYMFVMSFIPDIRRTFEYHGAEHKSIACYESGMELTPENAAKCTRLHPRCGTSFIFVILILSILIFTLVPFSETWLRIIFKIALVPVVVGVSFEFIMFAGKHDNIVTKILSAPGLAMQIITTKEPTADQLEVAIKSLKLALPEEFPDEKISDEPASEETADAENTETEGENSEDSAE